MTEHNEEYYYVDYKKFARIYLFLPFFFFFWVYEPGLAQGEINYGVGGGTIVTILLLHIFFISWVKKKWYVILREEEFETFSMNGKRRVYRYDNLNAPMTHGFLVVMLYMHSLRSDYKASSCVTDWIERHEECYAKIEAKRQVYEEARLEEAGVEAAGEKDEEILPERKTSIWGTVAFVGIIAVMLYFRVRLLGDGS